jgi:hypothetical protein
MKLKCSKCGGICIKQRLNGKPVVCDGCYFKEKAQKGKSYFRINNK